MINIQIGKNNIDDCLKNNSNWENCKCDFYIYNKSSCQNLFLK